MESVSDPDFEQRRDEAVQRRCLLLNRKCEGGGAAGPFGEAVVGIEREQRSQGEDSENGESDEEQLHSTFGLSSCGRGVVDRPLLPMSPPRPLLQPPLPPPAPPRLRADAAEEFDHGVGAEIGGDAGADEEKTREYLEKAGFRSIETHQLAHGIANNWYVVRKWM